MGARPRAFHGEPSGDNAPVDVTAERVARNQSTFRDANERIEDAAQEHSLTRLVPFLCECADPECTEIIRTSLAEYEEVRQHERRFLLVHGHERMAPSSMWQLVERRDGYVIQEKVGEAGDAAAALDPRKNES